MLVIVCVRVCVCVLGWQGLAGGKTTQTGILLLRQQDPQDKWRTDKQSEKDRYRQRQRRTGRQRRRQTRRWGDKMGRLSERQRNDVEYFVF